MVSPYFAMHTPSACLVSHMLDEITTSIFFSTLRRPQIQLMLIHKVHSPAYVNGDTGLSYRKVQCARSLLSSDAFAKLSHTRNMSALAFFITDRLAKERLLSIDLFGHWQIH